MRPGSTRRAGGAGERPVRRRAALAASAELKAILEALIFASPEPLTPQGDRQAARLRAEGRHRGGARRAETGLRPAGRTAVRRGRRRLSDRHPARLHEWVRRLFHERTTQKLTVQALETLAVIAYRQPITAAEITEIRGVNTSGVLNTLLERHLIKIVGRKRVVGRPFLYATTKEFLIRFGLNDLTDLPKVEDMAEALGLERRCWSSRRRARRCCRWKSPRTRQRGRAAGRRTERLGPLSTRTTRGRRGFRIYVFCPRCPLCPRRLGVADGGVADLPPLSAVARTSGAVSSRHWPIFSRGSRIGPIATRLRCVDRMADRVAHLSHLTVAPLAHGNRQRGVSGFAPRSA